MPVWMMARRAALVFALGALTACASLPTAPHTTASDAVFSADGRLSVVVTQLDGPPKSTTGSFSWVERDGHSEIALYSPLGDTVAQVEVHDGYATLRTPDGKLEYAPTPEALMGRVLGVALPVAGLRDWMRGRTRAGVAQAPTAFDEDGWHVSYPRMSDDGRMPKTVRLERGAPDAVEVRIVIDTWQAAPGDALATGQRAA